MFRDDYDRLRDDGLIVEVKDGYIGVFFSKCGKKGGVLMEAKDPTIKKYALKTMTATTFENANYIGSPVKGTAEFRGIGGSCTGN